jgi:hypothetical protein
VGGSGGPPPTTTTTTVPRVAPTFATSAPATFYVGETNSFEVHASGSPVPSLVESGTLPSGVTFVDQHDGTAAFSGVPAHDARGVYNIVVSATNGVGPPVTMAVQIMVIQPGPLQITSSPVAFCELDRNCVITLSATGAPAPTLSISGALPPGLTFTSTGNGTATITGVASVLSRFGYQLTLTASNGVQSTDTQRLWVLVWARNSN